MYLVHHGVKGQKWGVRRYQKPDGTLTYEGYKRYYGGNPNARMTRHGVVDSKTGKILYRTPSKKERKENLRKYKEEKLADKGDYLRKQGVPTDASKPAFTPKQEKIFNSMLVQLTGVGGLIGMTVDATQRRAVSYSVSRELNKQKNTKMAEVDAFLDRAEKRHNAIFKARTDAFKSVYGENTKVDFEKIYEEMNADMSIDDNDYYKEVEAAWRKKHGFKPLDEIG